MPSLRNLPLSLSILAFMAHLGQCAAPTGPANITVIDTTTGVTLGCLNATAQVVPTTECAEFDAAGGQGMGLIEVFDSATGTFNFLGFQIGTPDILVTSESLALADEWSVSSSVGRGNCTNELIEFLFLDTRECASDGTRGKGFPRSWHHY